MPSDDIVTRLRDWANRLYPMQYGACMEQAADEIERLRNDLAEARHEYNKLSEKYTREVRGE